MRWRLTVWLVPLVAMLGVLRFAHAPTRDLSHLRPLRPEGEDAPGHLRPRRELQLHAHLTAQGVALDWVGTEPAKVVRSTAVIARSGLNGSLYPVCVLGSYRGQALDPTPPDGVRLFYQLEVGTQVSEVVSVDTPARPLPTLQAPELWVDKLHYVLEVREAGVCRKRYPLALGKNPRGRKLYYDNSTTPEGLYRITGLQSDSPFHKAYDMDYPTGLDHVRYSMARRDGYQFPDGATGYPPIGGEIEIHAGDIQHNATSGCICLREADIDELFAHPEIAAGCRLTIVGSEFTPEMAGGRSDYKRVQDRLRALGSNPGSSDGKLGLSTCRALGRFQESRGLPLTLLPDPATLRAL
jgi:hypothetical protein